MSIDKILGYLRINSTITDTVLYGMLEQLENDAYDRGYDAGYSCGYASAEDTSVSS
jgi:hypothetical protein